MAEDDLSLEEFEAMLQEIDQKNDKIIEAILKGSQGKDAIVLSDKTHTRGVVITASAKNPHLYQATYFNERGFTTHEAASTRDTLIRKAVEHNGMTEPDDSLLEQFSKEPSFHIQNATYWYQNQHAGETAIRDLVVSNAPREGAKNFDPLFVSFCRAYQEELQKRHIKIIPGKKADLTLNERTQITKTVTQKLIKTKQVTSKNLEHYRDVLKEIDPSGKVPSIEELQSVLDEFQQATPTPPLKEWIRDLAEQNNEEKDKSIKKPTSKHPTKSERKAIARTIVQEDVKNLFQRLHDELHLTPDDVTKLVHDAAQHAQTQTREPNVR